MASYGSIQTATLDPGETALIINKPSGLAAGDLMVALLGVTNVSESYSATGWTELFVAALTNFSQRATVLVKVADSSDAAASNFTFNVNASSDSKVGALIRVTGTFSGVANIAYDHDRVTSDTTPTFSGGVTPAGTTALLIMAVFSGAATSASAYAVTNNNPSWTERADINVNDTEDMTLAVATGDYASASATGDYSLSIADGTESLGILLAISDSASVTVNPAVITAAAAVQAPTVSGGANVSPSVITVATSIQAPTVSLPTPQWLNADKSASGAVDNLEKTP